MSPFTAVIDTARAERAALSRRLQALDALIVAIEAYQQIEHPPIVTQALPASPAAPRSATPVHPNTNADRAAAIEAALRTHGPLPTREVARIVGGSKFVVKQALQRLKRAGRLTSDGVTNSQRWALPSQQKPAAPTTKRLADVVNPQVGAGPACRICECAFSAHDPTSGRCFGKAAKCVCREFRS